MKEKFREASIHHHETDSDIFEVNDLITCPSDGTGAIWRVVDKLADGTIEAELANPKTMSKRPSYPRKMTIAPEAFHGWQKVK